MDWILPLYAVIPVFGFMVAMFLIAQYLKDNSIVDIGWGIGFILIAITCFLQSHRTAVQWLTLVLVTVWAVRLSIYIYLRNRGKGEDYRYAQWREEWGRHAVIRAFFQVFMLQGLIMLVVASPLYVIFSTPLSWTWNSYLAILVWGIGFIFEAVGDYQMMRFKAKPRKAGKVMRQGLWRYTRHANYFGDATQWWGLFLFTISTPYWYIGIIGPIIMNFLIVKVSGVALLEKKYRNNPKYADYVASTNAFIPWFPKKTEQAP